jgi:hypothetical protein
MREKVKSIIEVHAEDVTVTQARKDWAIVMGKKDYPKPNYYRNKKTGAEYYHLAGAIGWPGDNVPGYALIVGVEKTEDTEARFFVLEEIEDHNIARLLLKCVALREKYGYWESSEILRFFWGDDTRYSPITLAVSFKLREKDGEGEGHGVWIYQPDDFDRPDHFEIYVRQIRECLTPDDSGKKRLYIGKCKKLKNHLQNFSSDFIKKLKTKRKVKDYPAVFALGGLIHTLLERKPWLSNSGGEAFNLDF